jgi:hypothetical protein
MNAVLAATLLKIRRPTVMVPFLLAPATFGALLSFATFVSASRPGGSRISDPPVFLPDLALATAPALLLERTVMVLGAVTLAMSAGIVASEYTLGTVRHQLIEFPHRVRWLAATGAAILVAVSVTATAASLATLATAALVAPSFDVSTVDWIGTSGTRLALAAWVNLVIALWGFAILGVALAVFLRTITAAFAVALVYGLFEGLVATTAPAAATWLPGQALAAVAAGGNSTFSYTVALAVSVVLVSAVAIAAMGMFVRRDITE